MGKNKRIEAIICMGLIVGGFVVLLPSLERVGAIQYGMEHKKASTDFLTAISVAVVLDLLWAGSTIAAGILWLANWKYLHIVLVGSIVFWALGLMMWFVIAKNDIALEVTFKRLVMAMPNILGFVYLIWRKANRGLDSA
jgi:hypothetical protein